ncbi:MAG: hypothetical protein RBT49_09990 [Bacteroidales bacterium]|nr:hypothetical protein [Bacteroidales bacterium]
MKKLIISLLSIIIMSTYVFSQSIYVDNSLLFSQNNYSGTARSVGMSGAFGALGGDQGSFSINPAGIGVYQSSEMVFSPGLSFDKASSFYLSNTMEDSKYAMNVNNFGFVASYDLSKQDTRWTNFNVGITYNKTNNFNRNILFEGVNNYSLMEVYVNSANSGLWDDDYEGLFEETALLYYDSTYNEYWSEITDEIMMNPDGFTINQRKSLQTKGSMGELSIAFGGNYSHKLYVGLSVGIVWLNYSQYSSHFEFEDNSTTDVFDFHSLEFKENSEISGNGVNLKLGFIYKPIEFVRIGAALHTPTFYELRDNYYNQVKSGFDNGDMYDSKSTTATYNYTLTTPLRGVLSLGFQLGKFGLIDVDYEYVDYSSIKMDDEENSQYVNDDNAQIQNLYQSVNNIRAGGEFRTGPFYLRAGAAYSTSPYKKTDTSVNHDSNKLTYSGGVGYREKKFFIDFAYSQANQDYHMGVFEGNPYSAKINTTKNNFILSFGFKF